ncbi:uncharacterized protein VP01_4059g1, partial [Puccinia sorghi]
LTLLVVYSTTLPSVKWLPKQETNLRQSSRRKRWIQRGEMRPKIYDELKIQTSLNSKNLKTVLVYLLANYDLPFYLVSYDQTNVIKGAFGWSKHKGKGLKMDLNKDNTIWQWPLAKYNNIFEEGFTSSKIENIKKVEAQDILKVKVRGVYFKQASKMIKLLQMMSCLRGMIAKKRQKRGYCHAFSERVKELPKWCVVAFGSRNVKLSFIECCTSSYMFGALNRKILNKQKLISFTQDVWMAPDSTAFMGMTENYIHSNFTIHGILAMSCKTNFPTLEFMGTYIGKKFAELSHDILKKYSLVHQLYTISNVGPAMQPTGLAGCMLSPPKVQLQLNKFPVSGVVMVYPKNFLSGLQLTCSMLQPSFHPNSTCLHVDWLNNSGRMGVTPKSSLEFLHVNFRLLSKCFFAVLHWRGTMFSLIEGNKSDKKKIIYKKYVYIDFFFFLESFLSEINIILESFLSLLKLSCCLNPLFEQHMKGEVSVLQEEEFSILQEEEFISLQEEGGIIDYEATRGDINCKRREEESMGGEAQTPKSWVEDHLRVAYQTFINTNRHTVKSHSNICRGMQGCTAFIASCIKCLVAKLWGLYRQRDTSGAQKFLLLIAWCTQKAERAKVNKGNFCQRKNLMKIWIDC